MTVPQQAPAHAMQFGEIAAAYEFAEHASTRQIPLRNGRSRSLQLLTQADRHFLKYTGSCIMTQDMLQLKDCIFCRKEYAMLHKNLIRLLAVLLAVVLLAIPVSADASERLAVEREVYDYLTGELMLSTAAACGVLANIEHESAFQPAIFGDQGTSYGLCQWHNERFSALRGYCSALGLDYRTVGGQMAYLRYELGNKYTTLLLTLQSIDDTPDGAYRAAYLWCIQFERPSNMEVKAAQRGELAKGKYWPRYSNYAPIIIVRPEPEEPEPNPEVLMEQLKQNPVAIPLPPEEQVQEKGSVRHFVFEKPEFIYYTPRNLLMPERTEPAGSSWEIPALIAIGIAMLAVILFPTKKVKAMLYRQNKVVV